MKHLIIEVHSQTLKRCDTFKPAAGSVNYLTAHFTFSEDWSGTTKTAKCRKDNAIYEAVIDESGACLIPHEVLAQDETKRAFGVQEFYISVEGVDGAKIITTTEIKIEVDLTGTGEEVNAAEPTPEIYAQFIEEVKAAVSPEAIKTAVNEYLDKNPTQIETPQIVSSISEMTDITKHYVLDGYIYHNKKVTTEGEITSPNVFVPSTAVLNQRLSGSSGSASASNGYFITDFIAVPKYAETTPYNVRLNWELPYISPADDVKVLFYNSSKTRLSYSSLGNEGHNTPNTWVSNGETVIDLKTFINGSAPTASDVAFVKFQLAPKTPLEALTSDDIANLEITFDVNNVIGEPVIKNEWVNSGISYAPTFKTDLIGVLGEDNVIYLSETLPSGTYTLKYGDETYDTIGTITV